MYDELESKNTWSRGNELREWIKIDNFNWIYIDIFFFNVILIYEICQQVFYITLCFIDWGIIGLSFTIEKIILESNALCCWLIISDHPTNLSP